MKQKMKKFGLLLTFCFALLSMAVIFMPQTVVFAHADNGYEAKEYWTGDITEEFAEDCVIVVLDKSISGVNKEHPKSFWGGINKENIEDLTKIDGNIDNLKYLNKESFRQIFKITIPQKNKGQVIKTIRQLEKIEGIKWVGPNVSFEPCATPNEAEGDLYSEAWGLHGTNGINAEKAWDITTGSNTVRVGVLDSGIASHEDLDANVVSGYDFYNNDSITNDDEEGHGTAVAGVIGAVGNNNKGITGVAHNVQIVPMQIADNIGDICLDLVVSAISWAVDNNIDIINASFGTTRTDIYWGCINNYSGLIVCSAGNDGKNIDNASNRCYPANLSSGYSFSDRIITVGSIDEYGRKSSKSNYGATTVSLFAPGVNILSTYLPDKCTGNIIENVFDKTTEEYSERYECEIGLSPIIGGFVYTGVRHAANGYHYRNGTSFAAPFVTGVAALMLSVNPNLTAAELKAGIMNHVDKTSALQGLCVSGGKLNALKAVSSIAYNLTDIDTDEIQIDGFINDTVKNHMTGELTIPDTINGKTVTRIGDNAFSGSVFTSITIPSSVYYVGVSAFSGLGTTQSIIVEGNALERSGWNLDWANGCNAVVDYTAVDSGEVLPSDYLSFINVPRGLKAQLSGNICPAEVIIPATYNGMTVVDIDGFSGCFTLQSITIEGENIETIWSYAFANCVNLQEITLPDSIFNIGSYAFYECYSLERVNCSGVNLESIDDYAFAYCHNLQEINLSRGVIYIGYRAFFECMELPYVNFSNGVLVSEDAFFACGSIRSITIAGDEGYLMEGMLADHMLITIYTDQTEWGENWLFVEDRIFYLTIVYGCTLAEDEVYVISIVVDASAINEELIMMPPNRDGYTFAGWSTTEGGEVEYTMDDLIILDGMTLYAVWTPAG